MSFLSMIRTAPALPTRQKWAALGVLAAGLLLVEVNIFSQRQYLRYDLSQTESFTLSNATKTLLKELARPVQITLLLSSDSPFRAELKYLLESYRAQTDLLSTISIDPDRQPAEYLSAIKRLGNESGAQEPILILTSAEQSWGIYEHQLSHTDSDGKTISLVEQNLSEGLAQVTSDAQPRVCFITGHGEPSLEDQSDEGLSQLGQALKRANIQAERVPLDVVDPGAALENCQALSIIAPTRAFSREQTQSIKSAYLEGSGLLLFVGPLVDAEGHMRSNGLEPLLQEAGLHFEPGFVIENDPTLRTPNGLGEVFFATPKTHPITHGLSTESDRLDARVLIAFGQSVHAVPGMAAQPLLVTSDRATAMSALNDKSQRQNLRAPFSMAFASEIDNHIKTKSRAVVVGSSNLAQNSNYLDPSQFGSQLFVENAFAWVLNRRTLVTVPNHTQATLSLNLSEDSLNSLLRYVLLYLPLTAAGTGFWVLFRRHQREQQSRAPQDKVKAT